MKEIVSVKKQAEKIVALKMRGMSVSSLARRYNVSPRFMRDLLGSTSPDRVCGAGSKLRRFCLVANFVDRHRL